MGETLATADAALKEDYQPGIREQMNIAHMLLSQLERNSHDVEGRRAVLSLQTGINQGVGARAELGTLPTAGEDTFAEERVALKYNYGRLQVSGPVIKAMKSDKGSFVRAVDRSTKNTVTSLKTDVNRQLYGTSDGVIATTGVTTASTTVVLAAATTTTQMRQFKKNMLVDIGTVAAPTGATSANKIVSVNISAKTLVLTTAVTTATTDRVFRAGSGGSGANQKELTGLQTIISATGTLFNVNPTVEPEWAATEMANGGTPRAATETLFGKFLDEVGIASGSGNGNLLVTSFGVSRNYGASLTSIKRFNDTLELKGGWSALSINSSSGSATLVPDKDCTEGLAYSINQEHMAQYESSDWEFMEDDGAVLSRVPNVDAYEAVLFKYHDLMTDKRNAHGVLKDLTES